MSLACPTEKPSRALWKQPWGGAGAFINHDLLFISCGLTLRHLRASSWVYRQGSHSCAVFFSFIKQRNTPLAIGSHLVLQLLLINTSGQQHWSHFSILCHSFIHIAFLAYTDKLLA